MLTHQSSLVVDVDDVGRVLEVVKFVNLDRVFAARGRFAHRRRDGYARQRILVILHLLKFKSFILKV